jgi:predicted small lipoprotein YifL
MKRILSSVLVLSFLSIGLVGCGEKAKTEKKTTVETPGGSTEKTQTTETKTTGDNPPAPAK